MKLFGKQIRISRTEKNIYGRDTLSREPCQEFESAQIPEEKYSVCYNCGWIRKRHTRQKG